MRFLVKVKPDLERVNKSILEGNFEARMQQTLSDLKPEAAYFFEENGHRTAILIVDIQSPTEITKIGEPFFHGMHAEVHFHPVMSAQDLAGAKLQESAKKWSGA